MRPSARKLAVTILSFTMPLTGLLSQQKPYETLYGTQTRRDDLVFTSVIDPLLFLLTMVGSSRMLFFSSQYFIGRNAEIHSLYNAGEKDDSFIF